MRKNKIYYLENLRCFSKIYDLIIWEYQSLFSLQIYDFTIWFFSPSEYYPSPQSYNFFILNVFFNPTVTLIRSYKLGIDASHISTLKQLHVYSTGQKLKDPPGLIYCYALFAFPTWSFDVEDSYVVNVWICVLCLKQIKN